VIRLFLNFPFHGITSLDQELAMSGLFSFCFICIC